MTATTSASPTTGTLYDDAGARFRARHEADTRRRAKLLRCAPTARTSAVQVAKRSVPNPYAPGSYETAQINRRVDILEVERSRGEDRGGISPAAFEVGRVCQAMWERGAGARLGSSMGGMDRTHATDHELAVALGADDAIKVRDFDAQVVKAVGDCGRRVLRLYLIEGQTYRGHVGIVASEKAVTKEGDYFRRTLENLADEFGATGPERGRMRASRAEG